MFAVLVSQYKEANFEHIGPEMPWRKAVLTMMELIGELKFLGKSGLADALELEM